MFSRPSDSRNDQIQNRLLNLAAGFVFLSAVALSISPFVVARSWKVDFLWGHWVGFVTWLIGFNLINNFSKRYLPHRDPLLIPIVGILCGWGLLMIWRLLPDLGLRQSAWLLISTFVLIVGMRFNPGLFLLRRYKYVWLTGSLALTAATLIWGTNPLGSGPEMWLGCCGLYLQPSEPLKLMLVGYLAAYLADQQPFLLLTSVNPIESGSPGDNKSKPKNLIFRTGLFPLLAPTLIITGLALVLLVVQQDLGTAIIFLLLYAIIIYVASGNLRVIIISGVALLLAMGLGYKLFEVVQIRIEAWLFPFLDPSGGSYQIIQSLISIANGENLGRGLGLGYPELVPVAHSDLIFTSIVEEFGLIGAAALVVCLAVFFYRGIHIALKSPDSYRRYLGIGLVVLLVGQSILIIGGNLRLLPLTGVTLPFMSYGGSSLLISFLSLLILLLISDGNVELPAPVFTPQVYRNVSLVFLSCLFLISISVGWWTIVRGPGMLERTDNLRRSISDIDVRRGSILDRRNSPITESIGQPGSYERKNLYPSLSNIFGYTNPTYGQSGLEASLDSYLRGMQGNSPVWVWWNRLVYGFPPEGRDIRTSIDLDVQKEMDQEIGGNKGAGILITAESGEILAIASHPTFDANLLDNQWKELIKDRDAPLLNRAVQGRYPLGELSTSVFRLVMDAGGINTDPQILLPPGGQVNIQSEPNTVTPLQVVLLSATLSGSGIRPAPLLATAVNTDQKGWIILPSDDKSIRVISERDARIITEAYEIPQLNIWQECIVVEKLAGGKVTWYVGGTSADWEGTPLAIAVLLETEDLQAAALIGQSMLLSAMHPR